MAPPIIHAARDQRIYELRRRGWKFVELAGEFNISKTQVATVFYRECAKRKESPIVIKPKKKRERALSRRKERMSQQPERASG